MFEKIIKEVNNADTIYVTGHQNPDGDSIGSTYGVYLALKMLGKNVKPILSNYSKAFDFLPYLDESKKIVEEDKYDLLICVDSSSQSRLAISEEDFGKAKKVVMIDHHIKDKPYTDTYVIESRFPAACELVYLFVKELGIKFDKDIATFLYMGLITDTGSFNYSSTKPSTLIAAAELMQTGIDHNYICKNLNDTMEEAKLYLVEKAISNMEVYYDKKLRYTFVDYNTMKMLGIDDEDAEGMTNYLRAVKGTEVAVYVREKSTGELKVSMRSNGKVDVSEIAIHFLGGGHARAAGYTMDNKKTYEEQKEELLKYIGERI